MNQTTPDDLKTATTDPVRAALADKIEQVPVGPFAILLGMNDGTHFKEIVSARAMIVAALRTPAPLHSGEPVVWQARDKVHGGTWVHVPYPRGNPDFEYRPLYTSPPAIELDGGAEACAVLLECAARAYEGEKVVYSSNHVRNILETQATRFRFQLAASKPERAIARALEEADWSNVSIGNKALIKAAILALSPVALHDGGK